MFVRKKIKRSGSKCRSGEQITGKFTEVNKFGVAKSEAEADKLFQEAQLNCVVKILRLKNNIQTLHLENDKHKNYAKANLKNITR